MSIFTGNVNLLVAAPMLQDFLVDKDGTAMSGGTITCYHDNSRTTLKNWYYQTGTPGAYTYIALPNPLTLSAAGTICDANGVDTIPFFYPYSETDQTQKDAYYITIVNHAQTNQITRANFPFVPGTGSAITTENTLTNLIVNGGFWRNIQPNTVNGTPQSYAYGTATSVMVSPSQHDGFATPDINYIRTNSTSTEEVTFYPFPLGNTLPISNTNTPEYYLNHRCTAAGSANTQDCYQFPIALHVNSLANVPFTFSIEAQNDPVHGSTSTGANIIKIFILQDTGTGTSSPAPKQIGSITLSTTWTQYTIASVFPATTGLTLGNGGDDGLYLQVQMPLNLACSINFTKPAIYLTQGVVPAYSYETYDKINSVISSPRTGDIRLTTNSFFNSTPRWVYGWVPMNDGTLGNASSNATARANTDTWQLYSLLWNFAKPYDTGGTFNPICQMYTSGAALANYGADAYTDFNANKALALTRMMGHVFLGTVPLSALLPATPSVTGESSTVTASSSGGLLWTTAASNLLNLFLGNTVTFTSSTSLVNVTANTIYYIVPFSSTTFKIATSFANALAGTTIAYTGAETGTVTSYLQTTGSSQGEYAHTQLEAELAQHHHAGNISGLATIAVQSGAGTTVVTALPGPLAGVTLPTDPAVQVPFNVTQPSSFYNVLIKL